MIEERGKERREKKPEGSHLPPALAIVWKLFPALEALGFPLPFVLSCLLICLPHDTGPLCSQKKSYKRLHHIICSSQHKARHSLNIGGW